MASRPDTVPPAATAELPSRSSATRALALATVSFTVSFAAWGLIGGLAPIFSSLYSLTASQTALLVAVPVLLGSVARLLAGSWRAGRQPKASSTSHTA